MARRGLGPASLQITGAITPWLAQAAGGRVVVACSGGPDSVALLAGAAWVRASLARNQSAVDLSMVTIDHGLQPDSQQVAADVVELAEQLGVPGRAVRVRVDEADPSGPEAAARDARLAALDATGAELVLLGHTLDDQAESVLLGLARGSGARSLSGMSAHRGRFGRPLLQVRRTTTVQACQEWGLPVWQDPHNLDPRFLRSRVRAELMPVLAEVLGPGAVEALARSADLLRADADALDTLAGEQRPGGLTLPVASLVDLPVALGTRVLRTWLIERGAASPSADQVAAVMDLVTNWHGQGPVHLRGLQVRRVHDELSTQ